MERPKISIIIPAYNEEKYIGKTLESIRCAIQAYGNPGDVEVIVVNNNSSDNTETIARSYGATIVFEKENHIAKARNRGGFSAQGKYLIFVDADTLTDEKVISRVDELLSSGKVIGGGAFVDFDRYLDIRIIAKIINYLCLIYKKSWGAFLFLERETFQKIGGFDESLYGLEESAFEDALKKEGQRSNKKFIIISDCRIITSARRLKSRWEIIKVRIPMLWRLERKLRDRKYCEKIWYDIKR